MDRPRFRAGRESAGASRTLILVVAAITLFWVVMVALLLRREVLIPRLASLSLGNPAFSAESSDSWMGVYLDQKQVGAINVRTAPGTRDGKEGVTVSLNSRIRLTMLGEDSELTVAGSAWFARLSGLASFDFELASGEHKTSVQATVSDGILRATVNSGGDTFPVEWPIEDSVVLWNNLGPSTLNVPAMEKGQVYLVDTFDPMTMSLTQARMTYLGEEPLTVEGKTVLTRVVSTDISGIVSTAWVTAAGEVVKAETPIGFTLRRLSAQEALEGLAAAGDSANLLNRVAIVPQGRQPVRGAKRMLVRLEGVSAHTAIPTDETQRVHTDNCYVVAPPDSEEGLRSVSEPGPAFDEYLAADPFVQSAHPRIVEQAKAIVGEEADLWQRAKRINEWVYASLEKKAVLSVPSALDVLTTGEGDCNEHTVLFAALARAAGIPTRIAIGIVWSDEYGGFYYHAWPEVYVGRWVWMDPTFGQTFADATHIKLLNGGIEKWWQVALFLGRLRVEVMSVEAA